MIRFIKRDSVLTLAGDKKKNNTLTLFKQLKHKQNKGIRQMSESAKRSKIAVLFLFLPCFLIAQPKQTQTQLVSASKSDVFLLFLSPKASLQVPVARIKVHLNVVGAANGQWGMGGMQVD